MPSTPRLYGDVTLDQLEALGGSVGLLAAHVRELQSQQGPTPALPDNVQRIVEAAMWANWCPDAGGYHGGRSVETCYEDLHQALCEYFATDLESPMSEWLSEEELKERLGLHDPA